MICMLTSKTFEKKFDHVIGQSEDEVGIGHVGTETHRGRAIDHGEMPRASAASCPTTSRSCSAHHSAASAPTAQLGRDEFPGTGRQRRPGGMQEQPYRRPSSGWRST